MNNKDLVIGDWVLCNGTPIKLNIGQIHNLVCETIWARKHKCEPIPLTDEVLKANGFIVNTHQAYLIDGIFLDKGLDGNAYWWQIGHCPICAINNVHNLQHALRLCGFTELADNFKLV